MLGIFLLSIACFEPRAAVASLLPGVTGTASNESLNDTFYSPFDFVHTHSKDGPQDLGGVDFHNDDFGGGDTFPRPPFLPFAQADSQLFDDTMDQRVAGWRAVAPSICSVRERRKGGWRER